MDDRTIAIGGFNISSPYVLPILIPLFMTPHPTTTTPTQLFNPVEIKPEMVGMYSGEFSMSYRYVPDPSPSHILCCGLACLFFFFLCADASSYCTTPPHTYPTNQQAREARSPRYWLHQLLPFHPPQVNFPPYFLGSGFRMETGCGVARMGLLRVGHIARRARHGGMACSGC